MTAGEKKAVKKAARNEALVVAITDKEVVGQHHRWKLSAEQRPKAKSASERSIGKPRPAQANVTPAPQALNTPRVRKAPSAVAAGQKRPMLLHRLVHGVKVTPMRITDKRVFDLRQREQARTVAMALLSRFPNSKLSSQLRATMDKAQFTPLRGGGVAMTFAAVVGLENDHVAESAAAELDPEHHREHEIHASLHVKPHKSLITKIQDELVLNELESNAVGRMFLASLLNPCGAPNPGFPDVENRAPSMKLRLRTVYLLPMIDNRAAIRVSRNPLKHITIEGAGGGGGFEQFFGPTLRANTLGAGKVGWQDSAGVTVQKSDSFVGVNATTTINASAGYNRPNADDEFFSDNAGDYQSLDLTSSTVTSDGQLINASYLPCGPGDIFLVEAWTSDTTGSNYRTFADFVVSGVITRMTSGFLTGTGAVNSPGVAGQVTAPANTTGVWRYGVINQGTLGTTTVPPGVRGKFTAYSPPLIYPCGASDLSDIDFLQTYANDLRTVGCRATATYVGKKLEGGYIVGGQLPQAGDDVNPDLTLATLAVIPGMKPRPLNGVTPGISFPVFPMSQVETDYMTTQDLMDAEDFAEGAIEIVTTGADADFIILQTEMALQARTERQVLMATEGEVDATAVSETLSFVAARGPLSFVTGNDDHEVAAHAVERSYAESHPTFSFFNGWFSGNTTSVDASQKIKA